MSTMEKWLGTKNNNRVVRRRCNSPKVIEQSGVKMTIRCNMEFNHGSSMDDGPVVHTDGKAVWED